LGWLTTTRLGYTRKKDLVEYSFRTQQHASSQVQCAQILLRPLDNMYAHPIGVNMQQYMSL